MSIQLDTRELSRLAADLGRVPASVVPACGVVLDQTAQIVRDDMRRVARSRRSIRHFARSITYDIRGLRAEIGPDKNLRQGPLGNVLYFGTHRHGPVLEHPNAALDRAAPRFEATLASVVEQALAGGVVAAPAAPARQRDATGRFL